MKIMNEMNLLKEKVSQSVIEKVYNTIKAYIFLQLME